jgi:phage gp36-like protein
VSYAAQSDLATRYGERELVLVTDKSTPPTGLVDATVVARALADADALIDSFLGTRYAVPISEPAPAVIVSVACQIARYRLHEDRPTEPIRAAYEDAIRWLERVSQGRANVPGLTEPTTSVDPIEGASEGRFAVRAPEPVFTGELLSRMP